MIPLSVNYSRGLFELLQARLAPIQAIEFGPWYPPEQIASLRQKIPHLPFHFHHGNLIARLKWVDKSYQMLWSYLDCTDCAWISAHISMLPPGDVFLAKHFGWYRQGLPADKAERLFTQAVAGLKNALLQKQISTPIILENMPAFPTRRYAYEVDPQRIRRVLDATQTGFLLDLAHARVASSVLGWEIHDYLQQLPLERTVQIHVSGPRMRKQVLQDTHDPMQKEDYQLLEWVLARVTPKMVTLEYYKDKNQLAEQLSQLAHILAD